MTHRIEVRRASSPEAPWQRLTLATLTVRQAHDMVATLDRDWEARVVPHAPVSDTTLLERLSPLIEIDPTVMSQVKLGRHVSEDILRPLRQFLYGAFERLHDCPEVFDRWSPKHNTLDHLSKCRGGKFTWATEFAGEISGGAWLRRQEMERRARHLNEVTIPGLGIDARMVIRPARVHEGHCDKCKVTGSAMSIVAEVLYGAHVLRREYVL